jgi:hypothetical protein
MGGGVRSMRAFWDRGGILLAGELLFGASVVLGIASNSIGVETTSGALLGLLAIAAGLLTLLATGLSAPSRVLRWLATVTFEIAALILPVVSAT